MRRETLRVYVGLAVVAILSSLLLTKNVDFSVYWYGVNGFFSGARPAYGPGSGIGFPLEYRYPPVTYLLLYALTWVSLRTGGFLWMLAAWMTAIVAVSLLIRIRGLRFSRTPTLACCGFLLAYLVLAIRYGNVQPFVIAWLLMALTLSEKYPLWSGMLFALAVTFKIWPLMFLPWFFFRSRVKAAAFFAVTFAALWATPALFFGFARYWSLLQDWYTAVARVGTAYSEFYYFPGQSLRGILLRYVTPIPPPLKTFPSIHILSLSPRTAVMAWMVIGLAAYSFFVVHLLRSNPTKLWAWDGLVFALYSLLEPYAVKSGLISLAPAALIGASLSTLGSGKYLAEIPENSAVRRSIRIANGLFLAACLISFGQAIIQYKPLQRYLLSFGLDFWGDVLLLIAFFIWIKRTSLAERVTTPESYSRA